MLQPEHLEKIHKPLRQSLAEFRDFIRERGVVGLAIGFVVGSAVGKLVSSMVSDIIQPLVGYVFGSETGLSSLQFGAVTYGRFLANLIDFVILILVVFFSFKALKLEQLEKPKEEKE
ncbi:MAG: MscL family protein [Patescibacteria group bacterium]|nr:MscL family protein [Patescibacteria group bacterium]